MKKKMLIAWGSPYAFHETIAPLIPKLASNFSVSIILMDGHIPKNVIGTLDEMAGQKLTEKYWIIPNLKNLIMYFAFLEKYRNEWQKYNFDVFLTQSEMQVHERFLLDCVLSRDCLKVCFWPQITYLLQHEELVNNLFGHKNKKVARPLIPSTRDNAFLKLVKKLNAGANYLSLLNLTVRFLMLKVKSVYQNIFWFIHEKISRFVFPMILFGKTFPMGKYDAMTQLGSGRLNSYIFCDEIESKAFSKLFNNENVFTVKYPIQGSCRCSNIKKHKESLLVTLSTSFDPAPEYLDVFSRDINCILEHMSLKSVHLRLHPALNQIDYNYLRAYLERKGIKTDIVDNKISLKDIVCDYPAVAAIWSNSLRDARACCDYALVFGLEDVAKKMLKINPRVWFGKSEGITWIGSNNIYTADAFTNKKYIPPEREGIENIILKLVNKGIDS